MRVEEWVLPKRSLTMELSEAEIRLVKEDNRRRIRQVICCVVISMTLLSFFLVTTSLALGASIDRLVEDAWKEREDSLPMFSRPRNSSQNSA